MNDLQAKFLEELKALLKKYNASINFCVSDGSDTYGLHNERLEITVDNKTIHKVQGWGLDSTDL